MRSAHRLYRLQLALGLIGLSATALALVVALSRVSLGVPSLTAIGAACRRAGVGDPAALAVLLLSSLGVAVVVLGARSAIRQLRSSRTFMRPLHVIGPQRAATDELLVVDDPRPLAFCAGLLRPRVYLSSGALELLDDRQLRAVVAHEAHHVRRRDPLRVFVARLLGEALFFLPVLRRLAERYATFAELAADEAAVRRSGSRAPLAAALLAFEQGPNAAVVGIAPERVDHLLGQRPRWRLSAALAVGAAVTLVGLLALVARTAEVTGHASVGMPLLLAQACMVAMTAMPVAAGALILLGSKHAVGRRRA